MLRRQLFRFLIVGGGATVLHYAIYLVLLLLGVTPVAASSIGFVISAGFNYHLNRRYTFASRRRHAEALPRFVATAAVGLALNAAILAGLTQLGLHPVPAQFGATLGTLVWNFLLNRLWTFRAGAASSSSKENALQ